MTYLGNDIFLIDGKRYSIKKAKSEELLHTWICPYCGHSELSYKDEMTSTEHFLRCKKAKKELAKKL